MIEESRASTVERAKHGDTNAFDTLVRRYQNTVVAYARTLLRDPAAAEDAAQEAFVQAWRDLPSLKEPAAFGAWLRRIVFKFCDRSRRAAQCTLPLDERIRLADERCPEAVVERADETARVHDAIDALPCALREATLLYYMAGHDIKEIASFLEVPQSTVKNRLYAARKRLRKDLWTMAETILEQGKPSESDEFTGNVLARVLSEFRRQEAAAPHTVNRGLLDEGRTALFEMIATDGPLDVTTVRDGFMLLWRKNDWRTLAALLTRYLAQPLTDSEAAWAMLHRTSMIGGNGSGSAIGELLASELFEDWLRDKSPALSYEWPFYPAAGNTPEPVLDRDGLRIICRGGAVCCSYSYRRVWPGNNALDKLDAALAEIPVTTNNRQVRFWELMVAIQACHFARDTARATGYVAQMRELAATSGSPSLDTEDWAMTLGEELRLAVRAKDEASTQLTLASFEASLASATNRGAEWVRRARYRVACDLVQDNRHDLAVPLFEINALCTQPVSGGWDWLMWAVALWHVTKDRERTLTLLREAALHGQDDIPKEFARRPEFADVRDDPEFLQAIGRE